MFDWCRRVSEHRGFQIAVLVAILVNAVVIGLETSRELRTAHHELFDAFNHLIQVIFIVELVIRLLAFHPNYLRFFKSGWNLFDLGVVILSFLESVGPFATVARLARVVRVTRLVEFSWELRLIVDTMLRSIPSMGHVLLLLGMLLYVYGVVGVFLFHETDPKHFGNLGAAVWTMFQTITFENWVALQDTIMAEHPWAWLFFLSFIIAGVFIGVNLFVAVVMNNLEEVKAEHARERKLPENYRELVAHVATLKAQVDELHAALEKMGASEKK